MVKGAKPVKKRIVSLLLAVVVSFGVVMAGILPVSAEEVQTGLATSDACVQMIKAEEGFCRTPYWDYAQYTVGYGTRCPDDKIEYYTQYGITDEEAEELLRYYLTAIEGDLNTKLIEKYALTLQQHQFDALVMFSYNCGTGWLYKEQDNLRDAIVSGTTGNELIDRFTRWCNAGGQILTQLLRRRQCEANMYLNGVYSNKAPENFGYVLYDAAGGTSNPNVQGFDTNLTAEIIPTPTYDGYQFEGWYTARTGGTKVTVLDASVRNKRLYAHWVDSEGKDPTQNDTAEGTKVTITVDELNVRQGPGTNYTASGKLNTGEQVNITQTMVVGNYTWGKFYGGWIRLDYTDYPFPENEGTQAPDPSAPVTGTVKVSDYLRVRSGPSTAYGVVDYLENGTKVEILEQKIVGYMTWGRIAKGWISLDYVTLDTDVNTQPPATEPPATEPPVTEPPVTEPPVTEPPATEPPVTEPLATEPPATEPPATEPDSGNTAVQTGTVKVNDFLRIRSGAGTSYSIAGYLSPNERVEITETKQVGSVTWGKIGAGWISLDYVVLDSNTDTGSSGSDNTTGGSPSQSVTGTVKVNDYLRIRSGPSTSYAIAGYLSPNQKVEILEQKTVGSTVWGRISKGWISLDYVVLDNQTSTAPEQTPTNTRTVTADCLRIRSSAGTSNAVVGYLYTGAKVEILETTMVGNTQWGRITQGWISMDYVK